MGDASEEWQAVGTVAVGDVVGSYDPVTGQWMCGRYDATHAGGVQPTVKTDHARRCEFARHVSNGIAGELLYSEPHQYSDTDSFKGCLGYHFRHAGGLKSPQ